jgi:hypothetical protein
VITGRKENPYRISVVSRAYCWSSLVRTSLTSVGVPENEWRTKLKYLILSSVSGTLKSPKYVDAYRQKSFRHTPSLGVPMSQTVNRFESGSWVGSYDTCLVLEGVPAFPVLVQQPP